MRRAGVIAAVLLGGCGLGPGSSTHGVRLTVTQDFGTRTLGSARMAKTPGEETVMRLLQRHFRVSTRYGGEFVQSINGLAGDNVARPPVDWFFYVNGIESSMGAAAVRLHGGDRVWWDHHAWGAAMSIPAVVGSYPEPFLSGVAGQRIPVTLGCAREARGACDVVAGRLAGAGVRAGRTIPGTPPGRRTLRVLVGRWPDVRRDLSARAIESGPATSGVFARFDARGDALALLDGQGRVARRLRAGTGLVAATRPHDQAPTWVVTGTDDAGVRRAAMRLDERDLFHRFAIAVTATGPQPVPVGGR